jgi:hypothetical protein
MQRNNEMEGGDQEKNCVAKIQHFVFRSRTHEYYYTQLDTIKFLKIAPPYEKVQTNCSKSNPYF